MKKFVTLMAFFLANFTIAQEDLFKKIDAIIASEIKKDGPGVMVGVVKEGKIIYEKYRGLANIEHKVKIGKKTRSNIASTAKQFTALMILQLSLEQKLRLEDDVRKYLPFLYPKIKEKIKIRHLINHTSGIRDYVDLMNLQNRIWWKQVGLDNGDILELVEKQEDLGFTPGSKYSYSNTNYNILAIIIEKVTKKKFTTYSQNFFKELGMDDTEFIRRYLQVIPNKAYAYSDWGYGELFRSAFVTKTSGEGFLYTTLKDQLKFEQAVQNASHNNNLLLIKSQLPIENSEIKTYGFGLKLENRLGRKAVHHDGATLAYNCQTLRFPKEKLTVFIMSNNGNIRSDLMANNIAKVFLPESKRKVKYNDRFYASSESNETVKIVDQYKYPDGEKTVEIIEKEGKKYWSKGSFTLEMVLQKKNSFSFANHPKMRIVFYKDEMVEYYPSGKTMSYKRNTVPPVSFMDLEGFVGVYYNGELEIGFQLKLSKKNQLKLKFLNDKTFKRVKVYNRADLLFDNNIFLKTQRDQFNRVTDIILTHGRAKNIRFKKKSNLKFQPKIATEKGSIQVTTISGSRNGDPSDILLTKNYANGNEIWSKRFGGKSYDKGNSIIATDDGYLIVGATSSFGNGNYDMFVVKTNKKGKLQWQQSYGGFYNEYGYTAEKTSNGFLIKGTLQQCTSNTDVFNRKCSTNVWVVSIDEKGKELSNTVLEEIKE
ncbi:serine hydrolase domain-containing protein [Flavobacteriaceae bacterium S356]|uniref:Serine hydrolase domain-containing protein n=1 Tax=Asprobacillus argus TaxID=3076534 RepID=A0ABU3LCQ1_9FLAO|nr:serine hydrolase domain-containing protein [Flavobacteriaceae bacterium S356]